MSAASAVVVPTNRAVPRTAVTVAFFIFFISVVFMALPPGNSSSLLILFVTDLFHPAGVFSVQRFTDGNMRHGAVSGGPMPVLDIGRKPDHIAGVDFLHRPVPLLHQSFTGGDYQRLPQRMAVPCGSCTRSELHGRTGRAGGNMGGKQVLDTHGSGKAFSRAGNGRLFTPLDENARVHTLSFPYFVRLVRTLVNTVLAACASFTPTRPASTEIKSFICASFKPVFMAAFI